MQWPSGVRPVLNSNYASAEELKLFERLVGQPVDAKWQQWFEGDGQMYRCQLLAFDPKANPPFTVADSEGNEFGTFVVVEVSGAQLPPPIAAPPEPIVVVEPAEAAPVKFKKGDRCRGFAEGGWWHAIYVRRLKGGHLVQYLDETDAVLEEGLAEAVKP